MTATTRSPGDEPAPTIAPGGDAPTSGGSLLQTSLTATICHECGAGMAPDQRYCVECGTRSGGPRFTLQAASRDEPVAPPPAVANRPSSMILIAGIATVLLALAVGFLIGKSVSNAGPARVVVTNVGGHSGGASTTPASSNSGGISSGGKSSGSGGSSGSNAGAGASSSHSSGSGTTPANGNFFGGG